MWGLSPCRAALEVSLGAPSRFKGRSTSHEDLAGRAGGSEGAVYSVEKGDPTRDPFP